MTWMSKGRLLHGLLALAGVAALVPLQAAPRPKVTALLSMPMVARYATKVPDPRGSSAIKVLAPSAEEAARGSHALAQEIGGTVVRTSGSPSMEPLIHGSVYVVIQKVPYETIQKADVLVYMGRLDARRPDRTCILHRAVDHDRGGWLMSGDNNRWSESWDRVTPDNYIGTVVMIFEASPDNEPTLLASR
jgi:hypothetical protein